MKKILILMLIILIAATVSAEELPKLTVGKYSVSGNGIKQLGEDIQVPATGDTIILWKPGKNDVCKEDCILTITGFECTLSKEGKCKGVSREKILVTLNGQKEDLDFGKNTQLVYDLTKQEFETQTDKFTFMGQEITSEPGLMIMGNKLAGRSFKINGIEAYAEDGLAKVEVYSSSVIANEDTTLRYREIELQGRGADYELCFSEDCVAKGSYVQIYDKKVGIGDKRTVSTIFQASGKSDGGPKITFMANNPVLSSPASKDAKFTIEKLEESIARITPREDLVPYVDLRVSSKKQSADQEPPVVLTNGRTTIAAFADDVWIKGASERVFTLKGGEGQLESSEMADSMPLALGVPNIFEINGAEQKVLFNAYNGIAVVPKSRSDSIVNEQLSDMPPTEISESLTYNNIYFSADAIKSDLKRRFSNLNKIEGFSDVDMQIVSNILNELPPTLTANMKGVHYMSDADARNNDCDQTCVAWADKRGDIYIRREGVTESTIYHELTHIYLRALERKDPKNAELLDSYDRIVTEAAEAEKDAFGHPARMVPGLQKEASQVWKQRNDLFMQLPLVKEWMAANDDPTMQTSVHDYCNDKVNPQDLTWKNGGVNPDYGVMRPYGCTNLDEDMATYVEYVYKNPERLIDQVQCPPPNTYSKKLYLLSKYGFVSKKQYGVMLTSEQKDCIGMAMR